MPSRLAIAAFAAAASVVAASPSVAHAGTPCWKRVLSDWTLDGKIDGHYSPACLRSALKHVPEDLGDYSSIKDDINAALLDTVDRGSGNGNGRGSGTGNGSYDNMGLGGTRGSGGGPGGPGGGPGAGQGSAVTSPAGAQQSVPAQSRSIPLPLLILGAIALAAAFAVASPPLIRRLRTRFSRTRAATQTPRG
jgi:hypothetical protein